MLSRFKYILLLTLFLLPVITGAETRWQRRRSLQTNSKKILARMVVDLEKTVEDLHSDVLKRNNKIERLKVRARVGTVLMIMGIILIIVFIGITVLIIILKFK